MLRNVLLHSERERAEEQQREDIDAEAEQPDSGERLHEPGWSGIRTDHQKQGHFSVSLQLVARKIVLMKSVLLKFQIKFFLLNWIYYMELKLL